MTIWRLVSESLGTIGKEDNDLSRKIAISNAELAGAALVIQRLGLHGREADEALEVAAKLAATGVGDAPILAVSIAAGIACYGPTNLSAAHAGDVLISTLREGHLAMPELCNSLGVALPISSALGFSFAEVCAAIAHYTQLGGSASEATIGLCDAMRSLPAPSCTEQAGLAQLGILRGRLDNDVELSKLLVTPEAVSFALAVTGPNAEGFEKMCERMINSAGATETAFDAATQTTAFAKRRMRVRFKALATALGLG